MSAIFSKARIHLRAFACLSELVQLRTSFQKMSKLHHPLLNKYVLHCCFAFFVKCAVFDDLCLLTFL